MHEKTIPIRWRDMDAFGHVNHSVYVTYLEEARDEWLERALAGVGDTWDFVVARVAVDYRRELSQADGRVTVRVRPVRVGSSSITTREEIRVDDGALAAESETVMVARRRGGGSRPLTDAERVAIGRTLQTADQGPR